MSEKQIMEFVELSKELIKWLNENCGPHGTIIITPTNAHLLEGQVSTGEVLDYVKDWRQWMQEQITKISNG